jgi:hypothetical protein
MMIAACARKKAKAPSLLSERWTNIDAQPCTIPEIPKPTKSWKYFDANEPLRRCNTSRARKIPGAEQMRLHCWCQTDLMEVSFTRLVSRHRPAYDHAFLTHTRFLKSPKALGQSLGFAKPNATLKAPYAAFACSSAKYVKKMYTHAHQKRVRNGRSDRL